MKNRLLFFVLAFLGSGGMTFAQFSNSFLSNTSRNNSGYVIEHYDDGAGTQGYIMATTSYATNAPGSATNGVRVIATNNTGGLIFDKRYTNLPDIHVLDICRDAVNNTYLFTGYLKIGGFYRAYILRIAANGTFMIARYYNPPTTYSTWNFQALSIVTYNSNFVAITGYGCPLAPTASNAYNQTNQQMFLTRVNLATLAPVGNTTFFTHAVSATSINPWDVPICMTDVPGFGLHITGSCLSNVPGRRECVLNTMFDYTTGNQLWEQSFMDYTSEDVEIGEFTYYDALYGLLYIATYKYNSRSIGIYMVDPGTGTVMAGMDYNDPTGQIYDILGLCITKDDINTPDDIYVTGYLIFSGGYPFSSTSRLPVFTTTMNITDLFSGTPNTTTLNLYDIPNDQYNYFAFTNHMLASPAGNTVVSIPSHLGFSPQMAIMDGQDIIISSNRISNLAGGWHPTMSKHTGYFTPLCTYYTQPYDYTPCTGSLTSVSAVSFSLFNALAAPVPVTTVTPSVTPCSSVFFMVPDNTEETTEEAQPDEMMGTEEESILDFRFYPTVVNDASATLYFELKDTKAHDLKISIYDLSGRMLQTLNKNTFAGDNRIGIDATNLAPGMNIVHISGLEQPVIQKVLRN